MFAKLLPTARPGSRKAADVGNVHLLCWRSLRNNVCRLRKDTPFDDGVACLLRSQGCARADTTFGMGLMHRRPDRLRDEICENVGLSENPNHNKNVTCRQLYK